MASYTYPLGDYPAQVRVLSSKQCSSCKEQISAGAIVCPKCRSFQGLRWWVRTAGLSLPWITATIATAFYIYPKIDEMITPLGKQLFVSSKYDFNTADLSFDFFNYSSRPVYVIASTLTCSKAGGEKPIYYATMEDQFAGVPIAPQTENTFAFNIAGQASSAIDQVGVKCKTTLFFSNYNGKTDKRVLTVSQLSLSVE